ncbi:MAG TPA: PKD domain-containing protein [Planctomycetota bacterium]|nr:PKD domain-containing protein [Planctomycetota bacterium]
MKPMTALAALTTLAFLSASARPGEASDPGQAPLVKDSSETVKSFTPSGVKLLIAGSSKNRKGPMTFTLVTRPAHGRVEMPGPQPAGVSQGVATYTSEEGYVGADSFTWKLGDGVAESKEATCTITVAEAPPAPQDQPTACSVGGKPVTIPALYHGGAGHPSEIKFTQPANGTVKLEGKTFHYEPKAGFSGPDSFSWNMTFTKGGKAQTTASQSIWVLVKKEGGGDWPQWRADEWRSGCTAMSLPAELHLQWRRELPAALRPFANRGAWVYADVDFCRPVQLGKTLFVPVGANDCLMACDTETGAVRWRFWAGGAVRRPPAATRLADGKDVVIFGADDGWVRCLNAADGSERWKVRAAPNGRMAMGFGRLSSVWPVWASPVISNGRVYFAAGCLPSQGVYAYCLDAASGEVVWVNDGRISDMWNTGAFGPLALSYDGKRIFGTVEGACRPWVLDSASGEFQGHLGVGFKYPGLFRNGSQGWYVDGRGTFIEGGRSDRNLADPVGISTATRSVSAADAAALGVTGKVASILAGDGKLFVTTAEGGLYCFGGAKAAQPVVHPLPAGNLASGANGAGAAAKAMLSREDLKQGLALVLGLKDGRLAEELAAQSSLSVVAVDPDRKKLQALRERAEAAGLPGSRLAVLEGRPLDFALSPYIGALVTSEDYAATGLAEKPAAVERVFAWARPFGGEIWLPASDAEHAALAGAVAAGKGLALAEVKRSGAFTQIRRTGLADEQLRIAPPLGVVAFGCQGDLAAWLPLNNVWKGQDLYSWLPLKAQGPGRVPPEPKYGAEKGYPTSATVTTARSIFTPLVNPLYGTLEKFPGIPSSGNDGSCSATFNRYGDLGMTHGKMASFFDASERYWGRLFFPAGGCPGRTFMWNGVLIVMATPVPGSTCGCSPFMQHTATSLGPVDGEENWVAYQRERSVVPVEELPVRRVGVNFGAPGDRLAEDGVLWTHHPYAGRYGRCSYNYESMPEALPLVPVTYRGPARSVYHHSAQMERNGARDRAWVAASQVVGMSGLTVHLAQPAVAGRAKSAPKVDGDLGDDCWQGARRLVFAVNRTVIDRDKATGQPKPDERCFTMLRYDDQNLYVAAGVEASFGPPPTSGPDNRRQMTVTLNSRERLGEDVVLTAGGKDRVSKGLDAAAWTFASKPAAGGAFTAEVAIPWEKLAAAGLWREQMVINVGVSGSELASQTTPLYLDAPRGEAATKRPHTVRLYFAEMEGKKPGERVFDVNVQGETAIKGLDVAKEAGGGKRQMVKELRGVAIADSLDVEFKAAAGEPMLSGVEILAEAGAKAPNAPPVAAIDASAVEGPAPLAVTLSARKSQDPDGQIAQCLWEAGDGRLARGSLLAHVFAEPGTYKVRLTVRDNRGALAEATQTIKVAAGEGGAFVCSIRAKDGDFATLSAWEAAVRSDLVGGAGKALIFRVKDRGTFSADDSGKAVAFAGGGTGTLRHVSLAGLALVSGCQGTIQAGTIKCASGHSFEALDGGRPVNLVVAECHNDWPGGHAENVRFGAGWATDATHCPVIRTAGEGGFMLKGDLDASAAANARFVGLAVDPASTLTVGPGASVVRTSAGTVKLAERASAADSTASTFAAFSSKGVVNVPASFYDMHIRDAHKQDRYAGPPAPSGTWLRSCTAKTFDPANQAEVEFVGCHTVPGGEGFRDDRYSEPGRAFKCVSVDESARVWDSGDGDEGNTVKGAARSGGTGVAK